MVGLEPRALWMLGKLSTSELQSQLFLFLNRKMEPSMAEVITARTFTVWGQGNGSVGRNTWYSNVRT